VAGLAHRRGRRPGLRVVDGVDGETRRILLAAEARAGMDAGIEQIVGTVEPIDRTRRGHCAEDPETAHPDRPCAEHVCGKRNSHAAPWGSPSFTLTRRSVASQIFQTCAPDARASIA